MRLSAPSILAAVVIAGAVVAMADLQLAQERTLVLYTTPALKDLLENDIIPRYRAETGQRVEPVYVAAGEQYNRLRMGGARPEADVFLHASPLFIEKGYEEGNFDAFLVAEAEAIDPAFRSRQVEGGRLWYAFAWTPLVEVYSPRFDGPPDLAMAEVKFGLAHPLLSNNGVYNVLYFETLDPQRGRHALARTAVQPVNARGSINGIADGSFDVTLGYEAVTLLFQSRGAQVAASLPNLHGNHSVVPAIIAAGLVHGHTHSDADRFLRFLFTNETQHRLAASYFRSVVAGAPTPEAGLDIDGAPLVAFDWGAGWRHLESMLKDYEVRS